MGTSDHYALPVVVFCFTYCAFIITMLSFITVDPLTKEYSFGSFSLLNVITSIPELGIWNILLFSPIIIALGYVIVALGTPEWV